MFDNITIKQHRDGRCFKVIAKMLMLLIALPFVLRVSASATNLAEKTSQLTEIKTAVVKATIPELRQFPFIGFMMPLPPPIQPPVIPPGCPLCDSSVYSYCSHKLIHDSCCCDFAGAAIHQKPPQCTFYDCTLVYAKSCYEHSLIKNCCCNNPY